MSPSEYEELVQLIVTSIENSLRRFSNARVNGGRDNHKPGKSTFKHQIDVSVDCNELMLLIECKKTKRPVSANDVLILAARMLDIRENDPNNTVCGMIASPNGFTKGAQKLATHFGITCKIMKSLEDYSLQIGEYAFTCMSDSARISDSYSTNTTQGIDGLNERSL